MNDSTSYFHVDRVFSTRLIASTWWLERAQPFASLSQLRQQLSQFDKLIRSVSALLRRNSWNDNTPKPIPSLSKSIQFSILPVESTIPAIGHGHDAVAIVASIIERTYGTTPSITIHSPPTADNNKRVDQPWPGIPPRRKSPPAAAVTAIPKPTPTTPMMMSSTTSTWVKNWNTMI